MPKIPLLALLPPVIFAGIAALFLGGMFREDPNALPSTLEFQSVPEFEIALLDGMPEFDPDMLLEPGVKLVNFWASWCAPCRVEHPNLMLLANEGIPVFGINYKDDKNKALSFLGELGDPYKAVGADPKGRAAIEWGVYGVPETFVVDGNGRVILRFAGPVTDVILEKRIRPAIATALAKSPNQ